jgi:hypothetical protein
MGGTGVVVVVGAVVAVGRDESGVREMDEGGAETGGADVEGVEVGLLEAAGGGSVAAGCEEVQPETSPVTRQATIHAPAGLLLLMSPSVGLGRVMV